MAIVFPAHPSWKTFRAADPPLPDGTTITRKPLQGKRVRGRHDRTYGNMGVEEYRWPKDRLLSAHVPKLCFVTEGPVAFQIADYVLHCGPGHGILLPPGTPFPDGTLQILDDTRRPHNACEMLMILPRQGSLSCWNSRQWLDKQGNLLHKSISCSVPQSQVSPFLHQIVDETTRRQLHWENICCCLLQAALSLLHRELQEIPVIQGGDVSFESTLDSLQSAPHPISRAEEYIRSNLRWPLTIAGVARYVYLSRTSFAEQFHARTGKTFTHYVNDCRFEESSKLLARSDLSIKHISLQMGIKERSLHLLIQQRTGLSPTAFRRQLREHVK
jgi:AraC-like DNA-binding protein